MPSVCGRPGRILPCRKGRDRRPVFQISRRRHAERHLSRLRMGAGARAKRGTPNISWASSTTTSKPNTSATPCPPPTRAVRPKRSPASAPSSPPLSSPTKRASSSFFRAAPRGNVSVPKVRDLSPAPPVFGCGAVFHAERPSFAGAEIPKRKRPPQAYGTLQTPELCAGARKPFRQSERPSI